MSRAPSSTEGRLAVIAVAVVAPMAAVSPDRFLSAQNLTSRALQLPEFTILALAVAMRAGSNSPSSAPRTSPR